ARQRRRNAGGHVALQRPEDRRRLEVRRPLLGRLTDGTDADLVIRDLTVAYQRKVVLRGVNARMVRGQVIGIIGPNGGGKSTLLKAILGIVPVAQGSVTLCGRPAVTMRRRMPYVPQREAVDWDFPVTVW